MRTKKWAAAVAWLLALGAPAGMLAAQTDYYNTDRHRPVRIEDAQATERGALEIKLAPLRVERPDGAGRAGWLVDPEVAYGILPRTSVEVALPLAGGGGEGVAFLAPEISVFHNLNAETTALPALAVRATWRPSRDGSAAERALPALTAIATRSFSGFRLHANALYGFGEDAPAEGGEAGGHGAERWLAGIAVDRAFPLRALLLIADVHASRPKTDAVPTAWHAEGGFRYQVNPYLAVDAGAGRRLNVEPAWSFTLGSAVHLPLAGGGRR